MTELADTSAWVWSRRAKSTELRDRFDTALVDGELATCDMVRLELLHSARNVIAPTCSDLLYLQVGDTRKLWPPGARS